VPLVSAEAEAAATARPDAAQVMAWLEEVPDPEIPVLSIVDLGIAREIAWEGATLRVAITPTYSGCPATGTIAEDIAAHLRAKGIAEVRVETRLSPPWTTDWLSDKGRRELRAYGIAPPAHRVIDISGLSRRRVETGIECPRCGSKEVSRVSQFGSTPCKAIYRCTSCFEPFDYFKPF
jgi:ring-1,2-phenylacetyl-CoA epoxidase subunit PaaD